MKLKYVVLKLKAHAFTRMAYPETRFIATPLKEGF